MTVSVPRIQSLLRKRTKKFFSGGGAILGKKVNYFLKRIRLHKTLTKLIFKIKSRNSKLLPN